MHIFHTFARLIRCLTHVLGGYWIIRFRFPMLTPLAREAEVQRWSQGMLSRMGILLKVTGSLAAGPLILAANHVSWLDILVLHAVGYCRFVSKAGIKRWPIIGLLASGAGTLFIEREKARDALRVMHHMIEALRKGEVVAVFPEGTTGDGETLHPFHANLLQAAISAPAPIQPVGIRFVDAATGLRSDAPRFYDDDSLVGSLWNTLNAQTIIVKVNFGQPDLAQGRDRRAWATHMQEQVNILRLL